MRAVYGDHPIESGPVRRVSDVVPVDIELPGCPISKSEFEWLVRHLILGIEPQFPQYPVCVECKQRLNTCVLDMGHPLSGSSHARAAVTRSVRGTGSVAGAAGARRRKPITNRSFKSSANVDFQSEKSPSGQTFSMHLAALRQFPRWRNLSTP